MNICQKAIVAVALEMFVVIMSALMAAGSGDGDFWTTFIFLNGALGFVVICVGFIWCASHVLAWAEKNCPW